MVGRMCYCGERPAAIAIYEDKLPLCMPCYEAFMRGSEIQSRQSERLINYLTGQMEMITGIPLGAPRFPEPRPPIHFRPVTNNIRVENSVVGAINTGQIQSLNVTISELSQLNPTLAKGLTDFSNAALNSAELSTEHREELVTLLQAVSAAAVKPKTATSKALLRPWLSRIGEIAQGVAALWEIWDRVRPLFGA
jgi:hypothetical protein